MAEPVTVDLTHALEGATAAALEAGALLGAVRGRESVTLNWSRALLSCRPLTGGRARPSPFWPVDALWLAEALLALGLRT